MKKFIYFLSILMILAGLGWLFAPQLYDKYAQKKLRPYAGYNSEDLMAMVSEYEKANDELREKINKREKEFSKEVQGMIDRGEVKPKQTIDEPVDLMSMRKELISNKVVSEPMWAEWALREYRLTEISYALIAVGFLLPILVIGISIARRKMKPKPDRLADEEKYMTDYRFEDFRLSGSRDEASVIQWIESDTFKKCDYCGGKLELPNLGFYKKIEVYKQTPEGAADVRLKLGEVWVAQLHDQATCVKCGKLNKRGGGPLIR